MSDTSTPGHVYDIDYQQLRSYARDHDLNAQEIYQWAEANQDYPQKYLETHGKVNFATYLKIVEFFESKRHAGTAFGQRQQHTAEHLRRAVDNTDIRDRDNAAPFTQPPGL